MFLRDVVEGQVAFVPTAAQRADDFSSISAAIRDPNNSTPFPGNQIPVARFDPVIVKLLPYIPLPAAPDGRFVYSRPVVQNETQAVVKAYYILGSSRLRPLSVFRFRLGHRSDPQ
jgi:hypothetical protein